MPGGALVAALLAVALLLLAVLGSRPKVTSLWRRVTLVSLRWASAVGAFLLATQPALWGERIKKSPGVRAVLIDVSQSMSVKVDDQTRAQRMHALWSRWANSEAGREARFFLVGDGLVPVSSAELEKRVQAQASRSPLFRSLAELIESSPDLGAIVVLSDGADTSGKTAPEKLPVKVHTVSVSEPRALRDEAIAEMHADAVAFLHGEARVQAKIRSIGFGPRTVQVSLRRDRQTLAQRSVEVDAEGEASVELAFMPKDLGREVYSLQVDVDPKDDVPENNTRSFLVRVTRERLRVLHVSGRPSWDQRFLRGFLKRDPSIDLVSFFILRSVHDLTMSDPSELALIPFPTDELFRQHLTSFDCVILQDFDYAPYQMGPYLPLIRDYVQHGGGLAMVGGTLSFDGGSYAETPLQDVLPVRMGPGSPAGARVIEGTFSPLPVAALMHHPILEIEPDPASAALSFRQLAPLDGANELLEPRKGAMTLLEHPAHRIGGKRMAVLAVGSFGKGRSLALGVDTSWHWSMPTAGKGGDPSTYDRFWDRAVRWLTRDPLLEPARIDTAHPTLPPLAQVDVTGLARDKGYRALSNVRADVVLRTLSGKEIGRAPTRTDESGAFSTSLPGPREAGAYEVALLHEGEFLVSAPFLVELGGLELYDPRPRREVLEKLSLGSGGRAFADPDDAPDLDKLDATRTESLGIERRAPFSEPLWVFVLLSLLCVEWALRRRWGET